jgi:hypothetical protein
MTPLLVQEASEALRELLSVIGAPGGVLIVMREDGLRALIVASMPDGSPVSVRQLLLTALQGAEMVEHQGGAGH